MDSGQQRHQKLLFASTRLTSEDVDLNIFEPLIKNVQNWQVFLNQLEENALAPLFYSHVNHHSLPIDANVSLALKSLVLRHHSMAQARYQAINELQQAFANASIHWIALKGLALASSLYDHVGQRPMRDMDILVARQDLENVSEIMRSLGYVLPKEQPSKYMRGTHQLPNAEKKINGFTVSIEIHHNAISQDAHDSLVFEDIKREVETIQWDGLSIPTLPKELMLHQLCRHLEALHPGGNLKLINVLDVIGFAESNISKLNWQLISKQHKHILNTLRCLNYISPLSSELKEVVDAKSQPCLQGVGEIMLPLSAIFSTNYSLSERLQLLLLPSDWWLHLYYGVKPQRRLLFVKFVRHPLKLSKWLLGRFISRLLGG